MWISHFTPVLTDKSLTRGCIQVIWRGEEGKASVTTHGLFRRSLR